VAETTSKHVNTATELTCLLPIRDGFAPVVDTITYATRMRIAFKVLQRLRVASREVSAHRTILDTVEAARTVHAFSWTIVAERNLLLNVSFDRPWEPYIRVVWKDLGPLLDLFLCNCAGYPSSEAPFDAFAAYVRQHQVETSFFYPASSLTVDDQRYLVELERLQRSGVAGFDKAAATLIARGPEQTAARERGGGEDVKGEECLNRAKAAFEQWLTVLNALYGLRAFYPEGTFDHRFLHRAARALLDASRPDRLPAIPQVAWYKDQLMADDPGVPQPGRRDVERGNIQGGILKPYERVSHGCLLLAMITDAEKARPFVGRLAEWVTPDTKTKPDDQVFRNIAFTFNGLRRLGVNESVLAQFPKEFREGMEARAGLLGDVRENHPDSWERPEWNVRLPRSTDGATAPVEFLGGLNGSAEQDSSRRVRLSAVDLVVTLQKQKMDEWDVQDNGTWAGHPLRDEVAQFCAEAREHGIAVVSVEPLRRLRKRGPDPKDASKTKWWSRDHFDYIDGLSQPKPTDTPNPAHPDEVKNGELLVGFANDREDRDFPDKTAGAGLMTRGSLIDSGSFLVVRKLYQNMEALNAVVDGEKALSREELLAKLMGRSQDGLPLRPNSVEQITNPLAPFTFDGDEAGAACPFHSHMRRSNPRAMFAPDGNPRPVVPRIARRSLAYGPTREEEQAARLASGADRAHAVDRGMMFMAYNASIAEQFEVIQRWMSGGNPVGERGSVSVFSGQPDPLLGLPDSEGKRFYQFVDQSGTVRHVDLGKPFVTVRWGLYLFAPSIPALRVLADQPGADEERGRVMVAEGGRIIDALRTSDDWAAALEDISAVQGGITAAVAAAIRAKDRGVRRTPYGVIVASEGLVKDVLSRDDLFSVCEYQSRFERSVGKGYLGMDGGPEYEAASAVPNAAVGLVDERQAFLASYGVTKAILDSAVATALKRLQALGGDPSMDDVPLPLAPILARVLGQLADRWFDIPDGEFIEIGDEPSPDDQPPRCPFHFLAPSRFVFSSPNPRRIVENRGVADGQRLLAAAREFVNRKKGGLDLHGPISRELFEKITNDDDRLARVLLGLVFGFVPTVYGNGYSVLSQWLQDETLWRLQLQLRDLKGDNYERANQVVRAELYRAMLKNAVPALLHRTVTTPTMLGDCKLEADDRVVLLVSGAAQEVLAKRQLDPAIVFGGDRDAARHPLHACPGKHLAIGALMGFLTALLDGGGFKPSPALATVFVPAAARQEEFAAVPSYR
jgi:deferrochelatase/peroxidase EfeB